MPKPVPLNRVSYNQDHDQKLMHSLDFDHPHAHDAQLHVTLEEGFTISKGEDAFSTRKNEQKSRAQTDMSCTSCPSKTEDSY